MEIKFFRRLVYTTQKFAFLFWFVVSAKLPTCVKSLSIPESVVKGAGITKKMWGMNGIVLISLFSWPKPLLTYWVWRHPSQYQPFFDPFSAKRVVGSAETFPRVFKIFLQCRYYFDKFFAQICTTYFSSECSNSSTRIFDKINNICCAVALQKPLLTVYTTRLLPRLPRSRPASTRISASVNRPLSFFFPKCRIKRLKWIVVDRAIGSSGF